MPLHILPDITVAMQPLLRYFRELAGRPVVNPKSAGQQSSLKHRALQVLFRLALARGSVTELLALVDLLQAEASGETTGPNAALSKPSSSAAADAGVKLVRPTLFSGVIDDEFGGSNTTALAVQSAPSVSERYQIAPFLSFLDSYEPPAKSVDIDRYGGMLIYIQTLDGKYLRYAVALCCCSRGRCLMAHRAVVTVLSGQCP